MSNATLKLYNVHTTKKLVLSATKFSPFTIPTLVSGDVVPVEYQALQSGSGGGAPYEVVAPSAYALQIGIFSDAGVQLAYQSTFTADASAQKYIGSLSLNDAAMTTAVSALSPGDNVTAYLQIRIVDAAGNTITALAPTEVSIVKGLITAAAATPPVTEVAAVQSWVVNNFVPRSGSSEQIILSRDGTKQFSFWVDNDGLPHWDLIN